MCLLLGASASEPKVYTQSSVSMGLDAWVVLVTLVLILFHFIILVIMLQMSLNSFRKEVACVSSIYKHK